MKIYAIRHGQTDWNAEERIQGCGNDLPLNATGRKQAKDAAISLEDKRIQAIITSPLKRASETAEIISRHLSVDIKHLKGFCEQGLVERNFGDYEGKRISEVDIDALRSWTRNVPVPNGESMRDFTQRIFDTLDDYLNKYHERNKDTEQAVLFVVHGHVLRAMYWYFNGLPEDGDETAIVTENCGCYEFDMDINKSV